MHSLDLFIHTVNDVTPLGLAVLLGVIIFLMVNKNGPLRTMTDNHLTHIQDSLDRIAKSGESQQQSLGQIQAGVEWLKGHLTK